LLVRRTSQAAQPALDGRAVLVVRGKASGQPRYIHLELERRERALPTVAVGFGVLAIGFFVLGAGLALPYATAPQLALSSLSEAQAGQGSGMVSACTFLGGSIGVAAGAIAFAWSGFVAVLVMLAFIGALGVALGRWIPGAARSAHPD